MLNEEQLGDFIDTHFRSDLFRLETLETYAVASDDGDFERYMKGEDAPEALTKGPWLAQLRQEVADGKRTQRLHVVTSPLSKYLRYECEWGYVYNEQAGEEIRILDLTEVGWHAELLAVDFFLVEDEWLLMMHYDEDGHFLGADVSE